MGGVVDYLIKKKKKSNLSVSEAFFSAAFT